MYSPRPVNWYANLPVVLIAAALLTSACGTQAESDHARPGEAGSEQSFERPRQRMIDEQLKRRGINDENVLRAMGTVERHRFVPEGERANAYNDTPLPIGRQQTISQPYIVGYMTQAAEVGPDDRVLEIGTGSGYQAAVLGEIAREVYSIEIIPELGERARGVLDELGYENVHTRIGDGYQGWPEHAPYDAIVVTAAPPEIPQALVDQLAVGGRMVVPVGRGFQQMVIITRTPTGLVQRRTIDVRFVPMTREPPAD
jgi:protein-L-isoaspartate(D-aspartate) O-methyltransferase